MKGERMKKISDGASLVVTVASFLITISAVIFSAGKLSQSISANTLAIQNNTAQIQLNAAEIVKLKEWKAGTESEIKNMSKTVDQISIDVKELLKSSSPSPFTQQPQR